MKLKLKFDRCAAGKRRAAAHCDLSVVVQRTGFDLF
jgi:hypothetical protein